MTGSEVLSYEKTTDQEIAAFSLTAAVSGYDVVFFPGNYFNGDAGACNERQLLCVYGNAAAVAVFRQGFLRISLSGRRAAGVRSADQRQGGKTGKEGLDQVCDMVGLDRDAVFIVPAWQK